MAALDVLRALGREPEGLPAFLGEVRAGHGRRRPPGRPRGRASSSGLAALAAAGDPQFSARRVVEDMGLALQGSLLVRHGPAAVADAFCASRLAREGGRAFGTLPAGVDAPAIVDRALAA